MLFQYLLKSIIHKGTLRLITADGKTHLYGDGTQPTTVIRLHRRSLEWTLGLNPKLKIGEAYMDGGLTIEEGTLYDFLQILLTNYYGPANHGFIFRQIERLSGHLRWLQQYNPAGRARSNVKYHYDLPDELYEFFLDPDRQYSCGYFTDTNNTLEQAQLDKKRHLASKLLLEQPGLRILDIGSGWGGMGLYLAKEAQALVTGVTLSINQYKYSRDRAAQDGLSKNCQFKLRDYRQEQGPYDRIISVGMFEHVGKKNYDEFFAQIKRLLTDDGVCVLHAIGRFNEPVPVNAFIRKHIFPGADVPVLSEVLGPIERAKLYVTDLETLRFHYAETLERWAERFKAHKDSVIKLYGESFYRKWEFYLISCQIGFRCEDMMVFQIQLTKRLDTAPITREYMYQWEAEHDKKISRLA